MGNDIIRPRSRPSEAGDALSGNIEQAVHDLRERLAATLARVQSIERVRVGETADDIDAETRRLQLNAVRVESANAARELAALSLRVTSHIRDISDIKNTINQLGWEWAVNTDIVEIPARVAVEVAGRTAIGMLQIRTINTDNLSPGLVRFNGDMPIAAGEIGMVACPFMVECKALYSPPGLPPVVGEILTTSTGNDLLFYGDETTPGFVVTGVVTETIGETEVTRATVLPYTAGGGEASAGSVPVKIVSGSGPNYVITIHANGWSHAATGNGTLYVGWLHASAILDAGLELMALETATSGLYETSIPLWL